MRKNFAALCIMMMLHILLLKLIYKTELDATFFLVIYPVFFIFSNILGIITAIKILKKVYLVIIFYLLSIALNYLSILPLPILFGDVTDYVILYAIAFLWCFVFNNIGSWLIVICIHLIYTAIHKKIIEKRAKPEAEEIV